MAGSVGSVETPQVFSGADLARSRSSSSTRATGRLPHAVRPERQPVAAGLRPGDRACSASTLAGAVGDALDERRGRRDRRAIWGERARHLRPAHQRAVRVRRRARRLRRAAGLHRQLHRARSRRPRTAATTGDEVKTQVAAFRIGDGELHLGARRGVPVHLSARLPRARTTCRIPQYAAAGLAAAAHAHAVPVHRRTRRGHDRLHLPARQRRRGARARTRKLDRRRHRPLRLRPFRRLRGGKLAAGDIVGRALVGLLDSSSSASPRRSSQGRYVLPDGELSRDPLGRPEIKCDVDTTVPLRRARRSGVVPGRGMVQAGGVDVARRPPAGRRQPQHPRLLRQAGKPSGSTCTSRFSNLAGDADRDPDRAALDLHVVRIRLRPRRGRSGRGHPSGHTVRAPSRTTGSAPSAAPASPTSSPRGVARN